MNINRKITAAILICLNLATQSLLATKLLFCHGFGDDFRQGSYYSRCHCAELKSFNFPEVADKKLFNAAQYADIKALDDSYIQNGFDLQNTDLPIIMGVSRGASVIITWQGQKRRKVCVLVLESPFACIQDVVEHKINNLPLIRWLPFASKLAHKFLVKKFVAPQYNPAGPHPIDAVPNIPKNIPIFMYASHADMLIPASSTMKLYTKFKELGHTKVHIFIVDSGEHANILWGLDGERCRNAQHAFYKHYDLPHNAEFAQEGLVDFLTTQP